MSPLALNVVKAICSLIAALFYAPFVVFFCYSVFHICYDCGGFLTALPIICGWVGPASFIFLILVEVDKPSPWEFLRFRSGERVGKPGSLTSYGALAVAILSILGFIFGWVHLQGVSPKPHLCVTTDHEDVEAVLELPAIFNELK